MTPEIWQRVRAAFEEAGGLEAPARTEFLIRLHRSDPDIAELVEGLLASSETAASFLETPPWSPNREWKVRTVLSPGQILADRFEVKALLGSGGMGEVYRAFDRLRNCEVALKTVRAALLEDEQAFLTLQNELNVASLVTHPNVCRLIDIALPLAGRDEPAFISMELLEGETLSARLKRGRMPVDEARGVVEQIASGLAAAHERGIVHRDLKPSNVMLVEERGALRAVIMDFGLARHIPPGSDTMTALSTGLFAGTPAYMAPEQLEGKRATAASDIHALGAMMFEMVTGTLPFEGETPILMASARLHRKPPRPRSLVRNLDPRWEYAILRCLDRDPRKRPATAAEALRLLSANPPLTWLWKRLAAAAALVALAAAFYAFQPYRVAPEAQAAVDKARAVLDNNQYQAGYLEAIDQYKRAIRADPKWPQPWAELAYTYATAGNAKVLNASVALPEARKAALEAVRLDGKLARGQAALGWTQALDYDEWPKAEDSFRRALALSPQDGQIHYWFGVHLRKKGRFREAERQDREALRLTRQRDSRVWTEIAFLYWTMGQHERMRAHIDELSKFFPNDPLTRYLNARSLKLEGKFDRAEKELDLCLQLNQAKVTVLAERASLEQYRGNLVKAREYMGQIEEEARQGNPVDGLLMAGLHARFNDFDKAFATLEQAYARKDDTLISLATSPVMDPLRGDPRFHALLLRLHFTDQIMQQIEFKASSASGAAIQPRLKGTS